MCMPSAVPLARGRESKREPEEDVSACERQERVDETVHCDGRAGRRHPKTNSAASSSPERRARAGDASHSSARLPATPMPASTSRYMLLLCTRGSATRRVEYRP